MKEIGKLLELLNEFRPTVSCANFKEHYEFIDDDIYLIREGMDGEEEQFPMYVCYKKGDFVKWLVENDKIDIVKVYENLTNYEIEIRIRAVKELLENNEEDTIAYLKLLMLLAIQDEPIRFLCEIIK